MKTHSTTSRWRSSPGFPPEGQLFRTGTNECEPAGPGWARERKTTEFRLKGKMRVSPEAVSELRVLGEDASARAHRCSVSLASLFPDAVRRSGNGCQHGMTGLARGQHRDVAYTDSVSARPSSLCLCAVVCCLLFMHFRATSRSKTSSSAFCPTDSRCMMLAWDCTAIILPPAPCPPTFSIHPSPEWRSLKPLCILSGLAKGKTTKDPRGEDFEGHLTTS